jgi:hypothetical protein
VGAVVLLAGPTAIAFWSGGYFEGPRLVAAIVAWSLVILVALTSHTPLPRSRPAQVALAGLAGLAAWVGFSVSWAPLRGPAFEDFERLLMYAAVLIAAVALLRPRDIARAIEPALAGGALVVVGYGLSERVLPGVVHLGHSLSAGGRLEQPITYWNAMGLLAALGFVLCVRIAGDHTRAPALRSPAACAVVPFGVGVYLSFSRGALAALVVGLVVLGLAAPTLAQWRAIGLALAAAIPASVIAGVLSSVRTLSGGAGRRELEGAVMLVAVAALCAGSAYAQARLVAPADTTVRRAPGGVAAYAGLGAAALAVAALAAANEHHGAGTPAFGASNSRLGSVESNRYEYWRVALRSFAHHPLRGAGSSSFQVDWLRRRKIPDPAHDAHSLYFETAAELGVVGLALLGMFLGGTAVSAVRLHRRRPELVAGWAAALSVWAVHAGLDWDWEMPAVSLVALILAGAVMAAADVQAERPA